MRIRNTKKDRKPLSPAPGPDAERILQTYELLQLDPAQTVLVGSAAATLYGIELNPLDRLTRESNPRPSDLDFAASPLYMQDVFAHGTPTGLSAHVKSTPDIQTILRIDTAALPADVITHYRNGRDDIARFHTRFLDYYQDNSVPIEDSVMRVITLPAMMKVLAQRRHLDPKAADDFARVRAHARQ